MFYTIMVAFVALHVLHNLDLAVVKLIYIIRVTIVQFVYVFLPVVQLMFNFIIVVVKL